MSAEEIQLLLKSLGQQIVKDNGAGEVLNMLIKETVLFRDKLKEDSGVTLTVGDTRVALDAFEKYLKGDSFARGLTGEQMALLQIWIDRVTLFDK